jgi:tRNA A-37 threonylcarbamoyl transferase component Bud32
VVDRTADHPGWEELEAYGQGRLAPEAVTALEEHLSGCTRCCELLELAPDDSFVSRLRVAGSTAPGETSPGLGGEAPDIPPELIDHPRYRVLGLVGQGGMGAVYRAEHRRMQRLVALKVIHPRLMRNPAAVQRFHQEVRAAARLTHANIVHAYDADQAGGLHFLVMEYVEGTSLDQVVRERGPLPVAEACAYARQAALGLQEAHERGMVHRDIKPHNLMLTPDGRVKILDFGLARLAHPADSTAAPDLSSGPLTGAGTVMGTADYIAPEQAADPRAADIRADVYALGCTLFHLLTGRPPFPEGDVREKLARHAATPLPPLSALRPEVPPGLAAVVARMTAKDPADRHATPAAVAEALAPFCPAGGTRPPRARRGYLLAAVLGLLAACALAAAVVLVLRLRTDRGAGVVWVEPTGPAPTVRVSLDTGRGPVEQPQTARATERATPAPRALTAEQAENQATEAVRKLGGKVTRYDQAPGRPVVSVNLAGAVLTDDDLRVLAAFSHLQTLDLGQTSVTDAGLEHLTGLADLTSLTLTGTRVTDAGMRHVAELRRLQSLDLQFTPIGDAGVKHLAGLTRLRTLKLYGPRLTDAGMADIGRLKDLSVLSLDDSDITDEGLKHLAGLTGLTSLRLSSSRRVGDEGMKSVGRLEQLQSLDIFGTAVTDRGLKELAGLGQLTSLDLGRLKGTDAGLRAFADLSKLEVLDLSYTDVTDDGLKVVAGCRRLWNLNLNSAKNVTDAGVRELAGLPRLKVLLLSDTDVTDAGIAELATCPRLTTLFLGKRTRVTDAGAERLRSALPLLRIQR